MHRGRIWIAEKPRVFLPVALNWSCLVRLVLAWPGGALLGHGYFNPPAARAVRSSPALSTAPHSLES